VRILFLCHRVPYPPNKGEKTRAFYQLRAMATRHEVDVFSLADDPHDLAHREALAAFCNRLTVARLSPRLARLRALPYLFTRTPLTIPYFSSGQLRAAVREAMSQREYDRIFVYCSAMGQYVPCALSSAKVSMPGLARSIPVVIDLVDMDSDKWAQYAAVTRFPLSALYQREARNLRAHERQLGMDADCLVVATEREAALARQIAPEARIHVVPVGVDATHFTPAATRAEGTSPRVIFTGDMSYFPNRDAAIFFARQVLPLIRRQVQDARFVIVGRNPGRRIEQLRSLPHVDVTGAVPDVRPWLAQATVAVAPLRIATGIQTKILEAMASGLPVIATARAAQGLPRAIADLVETGDNAEALAASVARLLLDPQRARSIGGESRRRVVAECSWEIPLQRLLRLIDDPYAASFDEQSRADPHEVEASA
jgi:sugar transferase (PEP-CTERM/EpsH1 system associated)